MQEAELNASAGQRVGLVGRNGSGKSTLLKIAAGLTDLDAGVRFVQPGATLRYLPQEPDLAGHATVSSYAEGGLGPNDDPHQARYLLEQLGLAGDDDPALLSGGQRRRAALARILAPAPDILLLDEPTNHLDLPTIEWLESELLRMRSAIVIISHDRRFLERMTRSTVWLDRGRTRRIDVGFSEFEGWRDAALAEERREQHKLDRKIADEEHWLRYGVTARRKRNERRVAELQSLRRKRREYEDTAGSAVMAAEDGDRSGSLVVEARNIGKQYDDRPLVKNFSLRIMRGDRIGIVGPNGAGKTTLIGMLIGATAPDTGDVRLGSNLQAALLDQARDSLDPDATLIDALTGGRGEQAYVGGKHIMSYLRDFLFTPEQARTPLRALSGGERARIMLARALSAASNLLVLDEPTNDLDLETLDVLQEMIAAYSGTVIIISHDRDFLDRTVNAIVAPDGGGKWLVYAGGYSDMLAQRGADVPARLEAAGRRSIQRTTVAPSARLARRRLSFHEMHALATLPGQMEAMQANIVQLRMRLDAPDLYQRDRTGFAATAAELAAAQSQLAAAEERWLELEILREEIDGS